MPAEKSNDKAALATVVSGSLKTTGKRPIWLLGIVGVVAVLSIWFIFDLLAKGPSSPPIGEACSSQQQILKKAAPTLFDQTQTQQLSQVVGQLKKLPNYQQDPNCDIILTAYYVKTYDSKNAQKYLTLFKRTYNPAHGLSKTLNITANNLKELESQVALLEKYPSSQWQIINVQTVRPQQ